MTWRWSARAFSARGRRGICGARAHRSRWWTRGGRGIRAPARAARAASSAWATARTKFTLGMAMRSLDAVEGRSAAGCSIGPACCGWGAKATRTARPLGETLQRVGVPVGDPRRRRVGAALSADALRRPRAVRHLRAGERRADGAARGRGGRRRCRRGWACSTRPPPSAAGRGHDCVRLRTVAAEAISGTSRRAHFSDPAGSLLLRASGRRSAVRAPAPCPPGST